MYILEELDPDPFMEALNEYGLPWVVVEYPQMGWTNEVRTSTHQPIFY